MIHRFVFLALAILLAGAVPASAMRVPSEVMPDTGVPAPVAQLRMGAKSVAPAVMLGPATAAQVEALRERNRSARGKLVMIGVNRDLPESVTAAWSSAPGGKVARLTVGASGAKALRLHVDLAGLPASAEMVFYGSDEERLLGPTRVSSIADRSVAWWSPVTEGAVQTIEFFVPEGEPMGAAPRVTALSHLFTGAREMFKNTAQIGDSGSCNIDIACVQNPSQALLRMRQGVAKMIQTTPEGTGLCSGNLLNDADTGTSTPWFFGANHCFDGESTAFGTATLQQVAASLNTYWFFEASTCGGLTSTPFVQRTGGATYILSSRNTDILFVRLNEAPPAGATFMGWDAATLTANATVVAIHHPLGDLKKFSRGRFDRFITQAFQGASSSFIEVTWDVGTTEPGSSGSGLFTLDGTDYYLRGGLGYGDAACTKPTGQDHYSRFDNAFASLQQYLASSTPSGGTNYTSLWFNEATQGWGVNLNHQGNTIFATLFNYASDLQPLWLVASGLALQADGSFTGTLYRLTGPPYFQLPWNPSGTNLTTVGTMTVSFSGPSAGTLSYSVNGVSVTRSITKQVFATPVPTCTFGTGSRAGLTNYQDLWFNPSESGWGINFTHQGNLIFATLFNYNNVGRDIWLVASGLARQADGSYFGELYVTGGGPFNSSPWGGFAVVNVGTMSVRFTNGENAVLTYTASNNTVTKNITRQVFGSTVPFCQ
jgi:lysyl endopeptidase